MALPRLTIPRLLVSSFAAVILAGTLALWIAPTTAADVAPLTLVDSLFTATSAVCVTGLTVRDTGSELNFLGQLVVLVMIQIGGLGILTLSSLYLNSRGKRLSMAQRGLVEETHGVLPYVSPARLLRQIVLYTLAIEALGASILSLRFVVDQGAAMGVWSATFHSISAFCNAGFGLHSDSLVRYQDDPIVNLVIIGELVLGGLGFLVFADVRHAFGDARRGRRWRLALHSRVVLISTTVLLVGGAALLAGLEMGSGTWGDDWFSGMIRAMFLSATTRTAGFNTVDMASLRNATVLVILFLMMVGGSPGSTAGGIKTTTAAALLAMLWSRIRNRPDVEIFDRSLPSDVTTKALATLAGFLITAALATVALEWTESSKWTADGMRALFLPHLFEVVSALCTVGLSLGVTPHLTIAGKIVITVCMFLGRLGPLVVGASFIGSKESIPYRLPQEPVLVG